MASSKVDCLVNLLTAEIVAGVAYDGVYSSNVSQAEILQFKLSSERIK